MLQNHLAWKKHPQLVTGSEVLGVRSIEKNRRVSLLEDGSSDLKKENSPTSVNKEANSVERLSL